MRSQRGIISGIEILVILVVLAAVGGAATAIVHTYNRTLTENEQLKTKNAELAEAHQDQLVENAGLLARQELLDQQTAASKALNDRLVVLERKVNDALGKLYAQSPEARKWAATGMPDDVRGVVRNRAAGGAGGNQNDARGVAAPVVKPDPGPAVPRRSGDERRPLGVRPAAGVKPQ